MTINRSPSDVEKSQFAERSRETAMHAHSFLRAAKLLMSTMKGPIDQVDLRMPMHALLLQACELAIKSTLIQLGYDEGELKSLGHDLMRNIAAAKREGVGVDGKFEEYCGVMNQVHAEYLARYAIRTFPWIGYDDALAMIEPQMATLSYFPPGIAAKPKHPGSPGVIGRAAGAYNPFHELDQAAGRPTMNDLWEDLEAEAAKRFASRIR